MFTACSFFVKGEYCLPVFMSLQIKRAIIHGQKKNTDTDLKKNLATHERAEPQCQVARCFTRLVFVDHSPNTTRIGPAIPTTLASSSSRIQFKCPRAWTSRPSAVKEAARLTKHSRKAARRLGVQPWTWSCRGYCASMAASCGSIGPHLMRGARCATGPGAGGQAVMVAIEPGQRKHRRLLCDLPRM